MDGSQPRRWARRTFLNGKSDDRREGAPAPPAHMCHIALHRLPDASLARVFVLTVRRRRAPPTTPPPTAPSPPPQPQPLPLHRRRRRRLHRRLHCHRHRPSPPRRGTAAGATGAARRVQGGHERPPAAWGRPNGRRGSRGCGRDRLQMRVGRMDVSFCRCCPYQCRWLCENETVKRLVCGPI